MRLDRSGVEVSELASVVVVVLLDLGPAVHARVEEGHDGLHLVDLVVDRHGGLVVGVKVDRHVAHVLLERHGDLAARAPVRVRLAGPELDVATVGVDDVDLGVLGGGVVVLDVGGPLGPVARRHDVALVLGAVERAVGVDGVAPGEDLAAPELGRGGGGAGRDGQGGGAEQRGQGGHVACCGECLFYALGEGRP